MRYLVRVEPHGQSWKVRVPAFGMTAFTRCPDEAEALARSMISTCSLAVRGYELDIWTAA